MQNGLPLFFRAIPEGEKPALVMGKGRRSVSEKGLPRQESKLWAEHGRPQRPDEMSITIEFLMCFGTFPITDILALQIWSWEV